MSLVSLVGIMRQTVLMVGSTLGLSSKTGMALKPRGRESTAMKEPAPVVSSHLMSGRSETRKERYKGISG